MIENAVKFLHTSVDVWFGNRLARRRLLVQNPTEGRNFRILSLVTQKNHCYNKNNTLLWLDSKNNVKN